MGRCNKCNEESTDLLCSECAAWWNVEDYDDKVRELTAENARLRRQVERLVALLEKEFVSFMVPMLIAQGIDKLAAKISAREAWKTSDAKQKADAILADEPDAATAIDKRPPGPEQETP